MGLIQDEQLGDNNFFTSIRLRLHLFYNGKRKNSVWAEICLSIVPIESRKYALSLNERYINEWIFISFFSIRDKTHKNKNGNNVAQNAVGAKVSIS